MKVIAGLLLCWLLMGAGGALAQDRSVSYSTWIVSDTTVTLRYVLPVDDARRLLGADVPLLTISKLEDYLLAHLTVRSAGGDCPAIDQGFDLGRVDPIAVGADLYGFEIVYRCRDPRRLVLGNTAVFPQQSGHIDFAQVQLQGRSIPRVFTIRQQELVLPDDGALPAAGLGSYLRLGFLHVMRNADRWCFALGMLILLRRPRDAGYLLTALAAGYVLAGLLSATGWVAPRLTPLEAFLGFLVAVLGAAIAQREAPQSTLALRNTPASLLLVILLVALLRSPAAVWTLLGGAAMALGFLMLFRRVGQGATVWPGLAVLFAFLDGFVLPAVLPPAQLPQHQQLRMLVGFDLGAVLFDAVLVGVALGVWRLVRTRRSSLLQAAVSDVCAAGLSGLGAFWLVSRLV